MINLNKTIEKFISWTKGNSDFELYNEAGLQHELLFFLRTEIGDKYKIYAERNISKIGKKLDLKEFNKKEMDIFITSRYGSENYCIELKYLTGNAIPRRMSQVYEDIKFLEELKNDLDFNGCLLFLMTPRKVFHSGKSVLGLYEVFRNEEITFRKITETDLPPFLKGDLHKFSTANEHVAKWLDYEDDKHKYFFVTI